MEKRTLSTLAWTAAGLVCVGATANAGEVIFEFGDATFTSPTIIDNDHWPVSALGSAVYASESDDGCEVNRVSVAGMRGGFAAPYDGITALVIRDDEWVDEECTGDYILAESTFDWHGQDDAGNVWYFGEDTTAWDDEENCLTDEGAWEAGIDGAVAGVVIPGSPMVGDWYRQEFYEGEAEDLAKVLRLAAPVDIDFGSYAGCMKTKEWTPLEPGEIEHKYYCRLSQGGFGLMLIEELKGKTKIVEYIGGALPDGDFPADFPTEEVCEE